MINGPPPNRFPHDAAVHADHYEEEKSIFPPRLRPYVLETIDVSGGCEFSWKLIDAIRGFTESLNRPVAVWLVVFVIQIESYASNEFRTCISTRPVGTGDQRGQRHF